MKDIKCSKTILIVGVIVFIILFLICCYLFIMPNNGNTVIESGKSNQFVSTNALTMMYETEANSGEYQVSSDVSWPQDGYTFNETLSKCENGSKLSWDDENKKVLLQANVSDKCYVYFDALPMTLEYVCTPGDNLANCLKTFQSKYDEKITNLYLHDNDLINGANDGSYRYSGSNPNNYICFGSTVNPCSDDNLYRIIGVFENQVKIIKNSRIGYYAYDDTSSSWNVNSRPEIYDTLNFTYFNSLDFNWQKFIAASSWHVSDLNDYYSTPKQFFDYEIGQYYSGYEQTMRIGLIYISDYVYGTSYSYWSTDISDWGYGLDGSENYHDAVLNNWLNPWEYEWLLTPHNESVHVIDPNGGVTYSAASDDFSLRPAFYLISWLQYLGGDGSKLNPIMITAPND